MPAALSPSPSPSPSPSLPRLAARLPRFLTAFAPRPVHTGKAPQAASGPGLTEAACDSADDAPMLSTCGWFDSTHDLAHGLAVTEHSALHMAVPGMPLADWLALQTRPKTQPLLLG